MEFHDVLEDRDVINYKSMWSRCENVEEKNILAIFSFYDICDVPNVILEQFTEAMIYKLKMLTLISFCELHDKFSYEDAKKFCIVACDKELEELLISITRYVLLKIDSVSRIVYVSEIIKSRDIYVGSNPFPLSKPRRTMTDVINILQQWTRNLENQGT